MFLNSLYASYESRLRRKQNYKRKTRASVLAEGVNIRTFKPTVSLQFPLA